MNPNLSILGLLSPGSPGTNDHPNRLCTPIDGEPPWRHWLAFFFLVSRQHPTLKANPFQKVLDLFCPLLLTTLLYHICPWAGQGAEIRPEASQHKTCIAIKHYCPRISIFIVQTKKKDCAYQLVKITMTLNELWWAQNCIFCQPGMAFSTNFCQLCFLLKDQASGCQYS